MLISNNGIEHVFNNVIGSSVLRFNTSSKGLKYIRAEVRKTDRSMQALTNPVWIGN